MIGSASGWLPRFFTPPARIQPQLDVLAHASVFLTHAGMGSAAESLWFGVPTVVLPEALDQFLNAATLVVIGAGA